MLTWIERNAHPEALSGQSAPCRLEGGDIEADAGEPRNTGRRDVKPLFRRHSEDSALQQTLCYGDPKSPRKMIVTMSSSGFRSKQATGKEFRDVGTRGLRGYARCIREFARRRRTTIKQGAQHRGTAWVRNQGRHDGDVWRAA